MYDVAIIGGGMGGIMAAYQLKNNNPDCKIIIVEKGLELEKRHCPAGRKSKCVHCGICSITSGYAGAGAFSDGKFNIGTAYGGSLGEELGEETAMEYIEGVDKVLESFSEDYPELFRSNEELKLKCLQNNLRLLDMNVRHLGTDKNFATMLGIIKHLEKCGVEMLSLTDCTNIEKSENGYTIFTESRGKKSEFDARKLIIATGRSGADFV
ncbi:MAG: FAD-dependent oxidoreductase, partial [Clostridia bacterium]|nr:FAD-dependent oxidoreductase [Clostridia bacterium]